LATLINQLTEAGRLKNMLNSMNGESGSGNTKVDQQLKKLKVIKAGGGSDYIFNATLGGMVEDYNRQIMAIDAQIKNGGKPVGGGSGSSQDIRYLQRQMEALKIMRDQLQSGAKDMFNPAAVVSSVVEGTPGGGKSGKGNKKTVKEEKDDFEEIIGLIPNAEEAVKSLQQQISESWDEGEIEKLTKKMKVAQKELQRLKDIGNPKELAQGISGFNAQTMGVWMQGRQSDLSKAAYGSSDYNSIVSNIADMDTIKSIMEQRMKAGLNAVDDDGIMESLWERVFDGENIPNDVWQSMVDAINEKLNEMNIQPIKINFETGKVENVLSDVDKLKKTISTTASVVGSIGQAFNAIEDPAAKVAAVVAQAIANVALAYSDALAKTTAEKFNIWGFIAAAAASTVSMVSTIASIHQATGYANGGIVKGNSYSGDNMMFGGDGLYGLNAGELVLTKAQQSNLANSLQSNGGNTVRVVGKIAGKDLFICAENWAKSVGKGEFVTW
jgi:hypothetical protein